MSSPQTTFANQFLIALPGLADPNFARTVLLICQHDDDGAMGIVVNRGSEYTLGEVLRQMKIEDADAQLAARPVLSGGPVQFTPTSRGFFVRDPDRNVVEFHERHPQ